MKKLNLAIAIAIITTTILLSSCHRNSCPTFGEAEQDTEQRS